LILGRRKVDVQELMQVIQFVVLQEDALNTNALELEKVD
jgi:hypothetical protein